MAESSPDAGARPKILIVDDEHTVQLLDSELTSHGYKVTSTHSPHDALELVEQIRFDLVFIDSKLPSMSGLDLYLAIKKISPTAVAIMITGKGEEFEAIAREAVRRTAYTLVEKPLDIDHILGMLDRITGQRVSGALKKPTPEVP
jgi:DNA-binding NtrC family response regulator